MTATEAERAAATVKIELERSVAKVFVNPQAGSNITAPNAAGGKAQMVDYSLDVLNTRMFWMRRPAPALSGNGTATTDAPTTPETETTAQAMRYAIDPNMSALSGADCNNSPPQLLTATLSLKVDGQTTAAFTSQKTPWMRMHNEETKPRTR